jgi:plasmid stabilization system protein ParE
VPATKPYEFHPAARREFQAADDWYAARSPEASAAFLAAISDALQNVTSSPQRWPGYLYGTRRFVLQRFPFSVIYLDDPDQVRVIAVAHAKRKPGYWKRRI